MSWQLNVKLYEAVTSSIVEQGIHHITTTRGRYAARGTGARVGILRPAYLLRAGKIFRRALL